MPATMEQVIHELSAIEPNYVEMAELGPDALPHLDTLVEAMDPLLASKAVCLAGVIGGGQSVDILKKAAHSLHPEVRIAAAVGAYNLGLPAANELLTLLLGDEDSGVRKVALSSIRADAPHVLRTKIEAMINTDTEVFIRELSSEVLQRLRPIPR